MEWDIDARISETICFYPDRGLARITNGKKKSQTINVLVFVVVVYKTFDKYYITSCTGLYCTVLYCTL